MDTAETTAAVGREIATHLTKAGVTIVQEETLPVTPPVVCVIGEVSC